ncbi:MAG: repressor [marine bacterium B5-7]|nr:MAG: repressor [marine bacterium B5-7]
MNVKDVRRENMRALARTVGGISAMANRLGKSQGQISHLIGSSPIKNIGDKIAAQVELAFTKPHGWLDREHAEIHGVEQTSEVYATVPLISWQHVPAWRHHTADQQSKNPNWVVANIADLSENAYALTVQGDAMEGSPGVSFPEGCMIVVDPHLEAKSGAFVVAANGSQANVTFKEYCVDGGKRYLKPLNSRYPIEEVLHDITFYGVVRQLLMRF